MKLHSALNLENVIFLLVLFILLLLFLNLIENIERTKEGFTELYFENYSSLPNNTSINKTYYFSFIVKNLENKKMTYRYNIIAIIFKNNKTHEIHLKNKKFTLLNRKIRTFNEEATIAEEFDKVQTKIILNYKNTKREIHFWIYN